MSLKFWLLIDFLLAFYYVIIEVSSFFQVKRKFSSFFKSLVIELDKDLYGPDNHLVEWHRTPTTQETDGFQVRKHLLYLTLIVCSCVSTRVLPAWGRKVGMWISRNRTDITAQRHFWELGVSLLVLVGRINKSQWFLCFFMLSYWKCCTEK